MRHPEFREQVLHDIARWTIRLDKGEHVIPLLAERQKGRGDRRDAGPREQAVLTALQLRKQQLQLLERRIRRTANRKIPPARRAGTAASRSVSSKENFTDW